MSGLARYASRAHYDAVISLHACRDADTGLFVVRTAEEREAFMTSTDPKIVARREANLRARREELEFAGVPRALTRTG